MKTTRASKSERTRQYTTWQKYHERYMTFYLTYQATNGKVELTTISAVMSDTAKQIAAQHLRKVNAKRGRLYDQEGKILANFHRANEQERAAMMARPAAAAYACGR